MKLGIKYTHTHKTAESFLRKTFLEAKPMFVGKGIRNFFLVNSKKLICFRFENFSSL
jgi:hypothetical protein